MWNNLKAWWNGLPHGVQAVLVLAGGAALGVLEPAIETWAKGDAVCAMGVAAVVCLKGYLVSAIKAAVIAVVGLYIPSSKYAK